MSKDLAVSLEVKKFICGPLMTNAFVIYDSMTNEGCIIDPAPGSLQKIIDFVEEKKITLKFVLLTHSHWDHIADCKGVLDKFGLKVFVHPEDCQNLEVPGSDKLFNLVNIQPVDSHEELYDGQEIQIGSLKARVIHTPGHSPGGVCFYFEEQKILFSGDTLFKGGYGTLDVATAEGERMKKSLSRLKTLAKDTLVYCGHGPSTTLGEETWLEDY